MAILTEFGTFARGLGLIYYKCLKQLKFTLLRTFPKCSPIRYPRLSVIMSIFRHRGLNEKSGWKLDLGFYTILEVSVGPTF